MKIAYVTIYDSEDVNKWSGLGFYIKKCLKESGVELLPVGLVDSKLKYLFAFKYFFYAIIFKKRYLVDREPFYLKRIARKVEKKLRNIQYDIIFSPGLLPIAFLRTNKPIVIYTDATFENILTYPECHQLANETIKNGHRIEKIGLDKCTKVIFSSQWAAHSAKETYGVPEEGIAVVPFGANIINEPDRSQVTDAIRNKQGSRCILLFVGKDWNRKGGNLALRLTKTLNLQGTSTILHVVGCNPKIDKEDSQFVHLHGFLDKRRKDDYERLKNLYLNAHFFVLFSSSEAYGLVYCEANAFGLPNLARPVGGVPTIIKEGVNGYFIHDENYLNDFATKVNFTFNNKEQYQKLALQSFHEYNERLNWSVAGRKLVQILNGTVLN